MTDETKKPGDEMRALFSDLEQQAVELQTDIEHDDQMAVEAIKAAIGLIKTGEYLKAVIALESLVVFMNTEGDDDDE